MAASVQNLAIAMLLSLPICASAQMAAPKVPITHTSESTSAPAQAPAVDGSASEPADASAAHTAPRNDRESIQAPGKCTVNYRGPPIITRVYPINDEPWQNNTVIPVGATSDDPDSYAYVFMIEGCGLYSFDDANPEIIGFGKEGSLISLIDDSREGTRSLHSFDHAFVRLNSDATNALRKITSPLGPLSVMVKTPGGRGATAAIYYLAPMPRRHDAMAVKAQLAPASAIATNAAITAPCVGNPTPRIVAVDGKSSGVVFSARGQWRITGCGFGDHAGSIALIARLPQSIALTVVSWSDTQIVATLTQSPANVADLDQVAVQVDTESGDSVAGPYVHRYKVFSPMPEGWTK